MPALDLSETPVINALVKANWAITHHPYGLLADLPRRYVYADLRLQHKTSQQSMIVVEVKCFSGRRSMLDEFYHAIGQYQVYQIALELNQLKEPLYMAVPDDVYARFSQQRLIHTTITRLHIKFVLVNLAREEVTQWIN